MDQHYAGARVRPELPAQRIVTLVVRDLSVAGDEDLDAAPVDGAHFQMEVGTLVLIGPAATGRSVVLCLSGRLVRRRGVVETGAGPHRRPLGDTPWRLVVSLPPEPSATSVEAIVADAGPAGRGAARRLGLGATFDRRVDTLDPPHRILLGVARALGEGPDIVALDNPGAHLEPAELSAVVEALRDLVDIEGRTVLLVSDLDVIPSNLRRLLDHVVDCETGFAES
ncbi:MAG: hypothetical protein WBG36_02995 [Ornithinimicrobium sp.]